MHLRLITIKLIKISNKIEKGRKLKLQLPKISWQQLLHNFHFNIITN